jgi:hypothetical protein
MMETLKKMFEANPDKSKIVLKDICSNCGCEITIDITLSSGGFGLQGGALFKSKLGGCIAKCPACYKNHPEIPCC